MSSRSTRTRGMKVNDEGEAAPAAAVARAAGRAGTRKRAAASASSASATAAVDSKANDEEEATKKAAASSSSAAAPPSKRARTTTAAAAAAKRNTKEKAAEKDDEEEADEEAKDEDATMGEGAREEEKEQGEESMADVEEAAVTPVQATLNALRSATVGHLFSAASSASPSSSLSTVPLSRRPSLPLVLLFTIFNSLAVRDIVAGVALLSRAGYASVVEYSLLVQSNCTRVDDDKASSIHSACLSSSSSSLAAAASASNDVDEASKQPRRLGARSDSTLCNSTAALQGLMSSRLRFMVTGVHTLPSGVASKDRTFFLDVKLLSRLSHRLSHLQSLDCALRSTATHPVDSFPPSLTRLALDLELKTWTESVCDEYIQAINDALGRDLPRLRELSWGVSAIGYKAMPKAAWFEPLTAGEKRMRRLESFTLTNRFTGMMQLIVPFLRSLPSLRSLHIDDIAPVQRWYNQRLDPSVLIKRVILELLGVPATEMPAVGTLAAAAAAAATASSASASKPSPSNQSPDSPPLSRFLQQLPLGQAVVDDEMRAALLPLSSSLTSLCPRRWELKEGDVSWVSVFKQLRSIRFVQPTAAAAGGLLAAARVAAPSVDHVVSLLTAMPQLTDVTLAYADFDDAHLAATLAALTNLRSLALRSKSIVRLEPFSANQHLATTLQTLHIVAPNVPREEVRHFLSLRELTSLNVAGSFTQPLFAAQLFPFQGPYPKDPLHWLRSFTPRGPNEVVPIPPVDKVKVALAQAEFGARVQAGQVQAAELLNSAQLSGVLQFLGVNDFIASVHACRAWRAAASLPSAWGPPAPRLTDSDQGNSSSSSSAFVPLPILNENGETTLFFPVEPTGLSPYGPGENLSPLPSSSRSRVLKMDLNSPQCRSSILPGLPLWKHARALDVTVKAPGQRPFDWHGNSHASRVDTAADQCDADALAAIAQLGRLESLKANWSEVVKQEEVVKMHQSIGPHLRRTNQAFMPLASLQYLTNLEQLELSWFWRVASFCPGAELAPLHNLKRLVLSGSLWNPLLARTVRELSIRHQLKELDLRMMAVQGSLRVNNPHKTLENMLDELAGAPPAQQTTASTSSSSSPALLEILRFDLEFVRDPSLLYPRGIHPPPTPSFPLAIVLRLPALRVLQVHSLVTLPRVRYQPHRPLFPMDLGALEAALESGATLPPIESLSLRMDIPVKSYEHLTRLTNLRKLRLLSIWSPQEPDLVAMMMLPAGCIARWAAHLLRLEVLMLEGVQVPLPESFAAGGGGGGCECEAAAAVIEGELACLARMAHLRALSLTYQMPQRGGMIRHDQTISRVTMDDLAVLPLLPKLEELRLDNIHDLYLQDRNWMDELGRPMPSSSSAAAASSSVSPVSTPPAVSMFTLLSQCRSLRLLRWASTESVLQSSADYTGLCSWDRTRPTVAEQKRRLIKEQARDRQALRKLAQLKKEERSAAAVAAVASADVATDPLAAAASFDLDANAAPVDYLTSADAQQAAFDAAILDEERDIEIDTKVRVEAERQAKAEKASKKK